jgi:hypothetical protein
MRQPIFLFTPDTFPVSAVSNADPTKTASASVNVTPLEDQERQSSPDKLRASGINTKYRGAAAALSARSWSIRKESTTSGATEVATKNHRRNPSHWSPDKNAPYRWFADGGHICLVGTAKIGSFWFRTLPSRCSVR